MSCIYPSIFGQVYGYTLLIPFIMPLILFAAGLGRRPENDTYGCQILLVWYSKWITAMEVLVFIIQTRLNVTRSNPYCTDIIGLAAPSLETFCIASFATFIICFTYLWNIEMPALYWSLVLCLLIGPPTVLVWFTYNTWPEVLSAGLLALVSTGFFMVVVRFIVMDSLPLVTELRPWTWMNCMDNYVTTIKQREKSKWQLESVEKLKKLELL